MKTKALVAFLSLMLPGAIAANVVVAGDAPVYRYIVQGTFDTTFFSSAVALGDQGLLTFKLDYSKLDTWPAADFGVFPDAVTDVHFSLQPGAAGNYPGGTMTAEVLLPMAERKAKLVPIINRRFSPMFWIVRLSRLSMLQYI